MKGTWWIAFVAGAYLATFAIGPRSTSAFDPMAPRARHVEQLMREGRLDAALTATMALRVDYPREPLVLHWIAALQEALGQPQDAARTWRDYVASSSLSDAACAAYPGVLRTIGDDNGARAVAEACASDPSRGVAGTRSLASVERVAEDAR